MASYFLLGLDTTAPALVIHCPAWTVKYSATPITIHAVENLGTIQDIAVIDSQGVRWPIILEHRTLNSFYGTWDFGSCAAGWARIEARVGDEVDNLASINKDILVMNAGKCYIRDVEVQARKVYTARLERLIGTAAAAREIITEAKTRRLASKAKARRIEVQVSE